MVEALCWNDQGIPNTILPLADKQHDDSFLKISKIKPSLLCQTKCLLQTGPCTNMVWSSTIKLIWVQLKHQLWGQEEMYLSMSAFNWRLKDYLVSRACCEGPLYMLFSRLYNNIKSSWSEETHQPFLQIVNIQRMYFLILCPLDSISAIVGSKLR